jgi:hypothetical protein
VSDTPRTDELWDRIRGSLFWTDHPARLLSERLERENNALRVDMRRLKSLLAGHACGCGSRYCPTCEAIRIVEKACQA